MGRIGQAVAKRATGFEMTILYYDQVRQGEAEERFGARFCSLPELLRESDFVSIHVPLNSETRGLIGARELDLMKETAVLVNTSRGPVVDEKALYLALRERKIFAAGLDVFAREPISMDNPLLELENVVMIPHVGSATEKARGLMGTTAAKNLVAALTGKRPPNLVNPEAWPG